MSDVERIRAIAKARKKDHDANLASHDAWVKLSNAVFANLREGDLLDCGTFYGVSVVLWVSPGGLIRSKRTDAKVFPSEQYHSIGDVKAINGVSLKELANE